MQIYIGSNLAKANWIVVWWQNMTITSLNHSLSVSVSTICVRFCVTSILGYVDVMLSPSENSYTAAVWFMRVRRLVSVAYPGFEVRGAWNPRRRVERRRREDRGAERGGRVWRGGIPLPTEGGGCDPSREKFFDFGSQIGDLWCNPGAFYSAN